MTELVINELQHDHLGPVSLHLKAGELLLIRGESGSGKTQLLRAIADLDEHRGSVMLDNMDCNSMPAHIWRKQVALLPAESHWWHETVAEHFPQQYDYSLLGFSNTVSEWYLSRVSTGEKQRLALLRLLVNAPQVLLLDEPTASLDPENTLRVEQLIREYRERHHAIVIWVSHDSEQIRRIGARLATMKSGRLEEETL